MKHIPLSPFLEIAIQHYNCDSLLADFEPQFRSKYRYYCKCRDTDLFSLSTEEASRIRRRTIILGKEIETLYAMKNMLIRLRDLYISATAGIGQSAHEERISLLREAQYWRGRYENEHAECMKEKEQTIFFIELAQKYLRNGTST